MESNVIFRMMEAAKEGRTKQRENYFSSAELLFDAEDEDDQQRKEKNGDGDNGDENMEDGNYAVRTVPIRVWFISVVLSKTSDSHMVMYTLFFQFSLLSLFSFSCFSKIDIFYLF